MMDSKRRQEFEENLVTIREGLPRFWWALYQGCLSAGFNERQAMQLLQSRVLGEAAGKIVPPSEDGPKSDKPDI